jgi:ATP-binding cassette, subfamily B, multidrug efflux pump
LFVATSNVFAVLAPRVVRYTFDLVGNSAKFLNLFKGYEKFSDLAGMFVKSALFVGGIYILLAILRGIFMFFMRQTLIVMSRHIEYDMKSEVFNHYQKLSMAFYKRNKTGDLMNRISDDVGKVRMYLGPAIMYTINMLFTFIFVIYSMFSVNPELTLYVLAPLPFLSVMIYYVSNLINKKSESVQRQLSGISSFVQETFSGIRILKAYNKEDNFIENFDKECEDFKDKSMDLVKVNAIFFPVIMLMIGLSTIFTVYVGGKEAIAGNISVGNIAEFIIYINMITWPVAAIGWVTAIIQRAEASQKRINEFLQSEPDIINLNTTDDNYEIKGNISFKNVSFTYPDSGIVALKNVSFDIEAGKTIALIGKTGSGKTTVVELMMRIFKPDSGEILIDNKEIQQHNLDYLRRKIGYVPQDVFLFSESISENISFGLHSSSDMETIVQAAKDASVHENIIDFPQQYDTLLGERGITLSGGQKQRISIARALIKKPAIFIFDDCLSAVDTETEENILRSLKSNKKGKTTIIISHRVSSIIDADKIIVLENGEIVDEGTPQELAKKEGYYQFLLQNQQKEEEV